MLYCIIKNPVFKYSVLKVNFLHMSRTSLQQIFALFFFFLTINLSSQSLSWAILETDCTDYEKARNLVTSLDNEDRVFSIIYSPQFIVYGSTSGEDLSHPSIQETWTADELVSTDHVPKPLQAFFLRYFEEEEEMPRQVPESAESCSQAEAVEKGLDEYEYANKWNSEVMAGFMTCNILFVESDGSLDPNYFTWPAKALFEEKVTILQALHTWAYTAFREEVNVTFIPQWFERAASLGQGIAPNLRFGSFNTYSGEVLRMNKAVINQLGYGESFTAGDEFNFDQKKKTAADGAFTVGVHYDHEGRGLIRAHAYLGGPYTFISSGSPFSLYGHEIGHIFHGIDEYINNDCEVSNSVAFNGAPNANNIRGGCIGKQTCVMDNNATRGTGAEVYFPLCTFSKVHLGWAGDIPTKPQILSPVDNSTFSHFLQTFTFYFPPGGEERKSGIIKIWRENETESKLVYEEVIPLNSDTLIWRNEAINEAGQYKIQIAHGQPYRYAVVQGDSRTFTLEEENTIAFADTCIWFCGALAPIHLELPTAEWYNSAALTDPIHIGDDFSPEIAGTYYVAYREEEVIKDAARVIVSNNSSVSAQLLQTYTSSGPIHLYLQSFTGIPHVRAFHWYKNDTLLASTSIPGLDVNEEGNYQVVIDNGCESITNILAVKRAPKITLTQDCENGSYLIQSDQLIGIADLPGQDFIVTDSLWVSVEEEILEATIYSPDQSIFWAVYELEPLSVGTINVENLAGFLRFKTEEPYQTVQWYRNDTLLLEGLQNWLTVDRPGLYQAALIRGGGNCPSTSQLIEFTTLVPPPTIEQDKYPLCLSEESELPTLTVSGENIRWYLEPHKEELIAEGNSFQPILDYYGFNSQLHITQTIDDVESPPLRVDLIGIKPLQASLDTFNNNLMAIINGIQVDYLPSDYLYDWFYDDSFLANTAANTYPLGAPGTYAVSLSNQQPVCIVSEPFLLEGMVSSTGTPNVLAETIQAYPNPVQEELTIRLTTSSIGTIQVFNMAGQLLQTQIGEGQTQQNINVSRLQPGFYLVAVQTTSGAIHALKFVKE